MFEVKNMEKQDGDKREEIEEKLKNWKTYTTVQFDVEKRLYEKFKYSIKDWKIGKRKMRINMFFCAIIQTYVEQYEEAHGEITEEMLAEFRNKGKGAK